MDIVLDTNIFRENFRMNSIHFQNLFDYLRRTNSKIIVPEIVLLEVESLYERELLKKYNEFHKNLKSLKNWLIDTEFEANRELEIMEAVSNFISFFNIKLNLDENKIIPIKDCYLKEVVHRAIKHIKPCSDRGEEFRDTILWLTVLDIARSSIDRPIGFISNNTNEFSSDSKTSLHPTLEIDLKNENLTVHYYSSLQEFIKQHAKSIQSITIENIWNQINEFDISEYIIDYINDCYDERLIDYVEDRDYHVSECRAYNFTNGLRPEELFIYERTDGTIYIEITVIGELEVEANIEEEFEESNLDYDYEYEDGRMRMVPKFNRKIRTRNRSKNFYPVISVTLGMIYFQEGNIEYQEIIDLDF